MLDLDEAGDAIVTIPHPPWKLLLCGLLAFAFSLHPVIILRDLLTHDPAVMRGRGVQVLATGLTRWLYIGAYSAFAMLPLGFTAFYVRTPEFAIDKTGIRGFDRRRNLWRGARNRSALTTLSWDEVRYCCWGRYPPCLLNIQTPDERLFVRIPGRFREEVEKALRAFGKWQE